MALFLLMVARHNATARTVSVLRDGWKFKQGEVKNGMLPGLDDSDWESVSIPHDWAIKGPYIIDGDGNTGKLPWKGEAWYRNIIHTGPQIGQKNIYLLFDGILSNPEIYINGKRVGKWDYGYNSFYFNITRYLEENRNNTIAIHVDTRKHDSRWYPGAGIFRKIQMLVVNPVHVAVWGSYVTTPIIKPTYADVKIAHTVVNNSDTLLNSVKLENIVINPYGVEVGRKSSFLKILPNKSSLSENTITIGNPEKWDVNHPLMYVVKTFISVNGKIVDEYQTPFGIRKMKFTADDGFWLNDRRLQLKGVNLHHDLGSLGAAFNKRALERQLEIMKSMGCNAIRNSHNMAAPELPELCDKMGLLLFNEAFDKYDEKADIYEATDFDEFAHRNIKNFVLRDRNHPCIFLWSVGNEIVDVMNNENNGFHRLHTMVNYVRKYDPTRPVTLVCSDQETAELRHFDYYDVHCWNYGRRYSLARKLEPNKSVIISESASTVSTRGFYEFPLPERKTDFTKSLQVSSYDLNAPMWAEISDDDFMWLEEENYVAGEFVWTGFDYLGEPTPYRNGDVKRMGMTDKEAANSSYFGIVDLCGIPKDRYYLYKSYWKPDETTIHILPHWNWEGMEGKVIPVFVYTNGDSAELFLNGKSQGIQKKIPNSTISTERYRLMWKNVKYEPGELKVIAYKKGETIGQNTKVTAGKPYQIKLTSERHTIHADGTDLSFILVEACDKNGNECPLADNLIHFSLEGTGIIAGVGNGNPQSVEPVKANYRKLFNGKAMLIIQSINNEKGKVEVHATSSGLLKNSIILTVNE